MNPVFPPESVQPFPRARGPDACGWCGKPLPPFRANTGWHPACFGAASRALSVVATEEERPEVVGLVETIERRWNLLCPDALRIVRNICVFLRPAQMFGPAEALPQELAVLLFPTCACGRTLGLRLRIETCGNPACGGKSFLEDLLLYSKAICLLTEWQYQESQTEEPIHDPSP